MTILRDELVNIFNSRLITGVHLVTIVNKDLKIGTLILVPTHHTLESFTKDVTEVLDYEVIKKELEQNGKNIYLEITKNQNVLMN